MQKSKQNNYLWNHGESRVFALNFTAASVLRRGFFYARFFPVSLPYRITDSRSNRNNLFCEYVSHKSVGYDLSLSTHDLGIYYVRQHRLINPFGMRRKAKVRCEQRGIC